MQRTTITKNSLTKDYILERIRQSQIFAYFLAISETDIEYCAINGKLMRSAFRSNDNDASMGFRYKGSKLICRDFGGYFWGDCFDVVQQLNYTNNFRDTLEIIASVFNLTTNGFKNGIIAQHGMFTIEKAYKELDFTFRDWKKHDINKWESWGADIDVVKHYDVFPVQEFFINGYKYAIDGGAKYPIYAFYLGTVDGKPYWKVNLVNRNPKYIGNGERLQGLRQITTVKRGGIMKSLKDSITLRSSAIRNSLSLQGLSPNSENSIVDLKTFVAISQYYEDIFTFSDFDRTGIIFGNSMKRKYGTTPYFLTNGRFGSINYNVKDLCEYSEYYGIDKLDDLVKKVYNNEKINPDDYKSFSEDSMLNIPF